MQITERSGSSDSYRYGFNGKEKDDEIKGGGNSYDFGARMYDSRLGRWFSPDPKEYKYAAFTTYNFGLNNPIKYNDSNGEDPITGIGEAVTSFAISAGMDFLTAYLIEGKSVKNSFNEIGWWSAGWDATKSYAVAAFTPLGTATAQKLIKLSNTKVGKITIGITEKMTTKIIDKYSKGDYDNKNGDFEINNVSFEEVFWEATIETLVEESLGGRADEVLKNLQKENKSLYLKIQKLKNKLDQGESTKRINNYKKNIVKQSKKSEKIFRQRIKAKMDDKLESTVITETLKSGIEIINIELKKNEKKSEDN